MRKKSKSFGLSVVKGQFVKSLGYHRSSLGNIAATRHYLGAVDDGEDSAMTRFLEIRGRWNARDGVVQVEHQGRMVEIWEETPTRLAERSTVRLASNGAVGTELAACAGTLTVADAVKNYLDAIKRRMDKGHVSHAHWVSASQWLNRVLDFMDSSKLLTEIGAVELTECVSAIASRPKAKPGYKSIALKGPISVKTAKCWLAILRDFLDEMSKTEISPGSERAVWQKPLRFDDIFRRFQPQRTAAELDQSIIDGETEADCFSVDEIRKLYKRVSGNDHLRGVFMLALNCGFAQMEIATLSVNQFVDGDSPKIRRYRGKTTIYAEWPLWSHTAELLQLAIGKRKADELAVVTNSGPNKGQALIAPCGMGRRDSVQEAWNHIRNVLPKDRQLSFKYLRKTGANIIRKMSIGGDAVAEMYLSHADNKSGVLSAYSGRDWAKLASALTELENVLFGGWEWYNQPKVALSINYPYPSYAKQLV